MDLKVYALLNAKIKELTGGGGLTQKEVEKIVTDEVAKIVAGAPADFDTLKEMSDWISSHENSAAEMNSAIQTNTNDISTLNTNKVDKVEGKSLISDSEITRLASVDNYDDTTIKQRVTTNETNISTLVQGLDTKADALTVSALSETVATKADSSTVSAISDRVSATETEQETLSARMDEFTKLEEGSTTGDAELIDGRIGSDGKTYDNIGGAIRGQVTNLKSDLSELQNLLLYSDGRPLFSGYTANEEGLSINPTTYACTTSSVVWSVCFRAVSGSTITIQKSESSRFIVGTFASKPVVDSIANQYIDYGSATTATLTLVGSSEWVMIVFYHNTSDSARNRTDIKNSIKAYYGSEIPTEGSALARIDEIETSIEKIEEKADNAQETAVNAAKALGLIGSTNLFDYTTATDSNLTVNTSTKSCVTSSVTHSVICQIPASSTITVNKDISSRFILSTYANVPASGATAMQAVDCGSVTSYTIQTGATENYILIVYFHDTSDIARDRETIMQSITVFEGTEWVESGNFFERPLTAMPKYITELLSYRPLGSLTKSYLCLSCDDGEATLATDTIPVLKAYKTQYGMNIPVTFGLFSTSACVTNSEYKSLVQEMVSDYGCSVAIHGVTTYTNFTEKGLLEEIERQKTALTNSGFSPKGIIYPQHSFNKMVCAVAGGQYGVCCTGGNYTDLTYGSGCCAGARSNMYALYRLSLFNSSMTVAKIRTYIDYAVENNLILLPFWHDASFTANKALLDECVNYALEKGMELITIGDIPTII